MLGQKNKGSGKPTGGKPTNGKGSNGSSGNDILDALKEFDTARDKRVAQEKKAGRHDWVRSVPGVLKIVAIVIVVAIVALVADGWRREGQEFRGVLKQLSGDVTVSAAGTGPPMLAKLDQELRDKDVINTNANSTATLLFPDGSAIQLEEKTEFEIRILDYARGEGGQRDRSFMVRAGAAVSNVSKAFGVNSQATVCTPTAVAAVRGTGFRVAYDPAGKQSYVQVVEGAVAFKTPFGQVPNNVVPGQMVQAQGYGLTNPTELSAARASEVNGAVGGMASQYEKPPSALAKFESSLNAFFDPVLQIMGIAPNGFGFTANDAARRATCTEGLRQLQRHIMTAFGEEAPPYFNPVTYEELQIDPKNLPILEQAFYNKMIESYTAGAGHNPPKAKDTFTIRARARDRKRTLYEITEAGGVREVRE